MAEAIAKAAGVPGAEARRAMMLRGALGPVAEAALAAGVPALREFHLQVGRPLQPMLASTAPSVEAAMERVGEAAVEEAARTSDPRRVPRPVVARVPSSGKLDGVVSNSTRMATEWGVHPHAWMTSPPACRRWRDVLALPSARRCSTAS